MDEQIEFTPSSDRQRTRYCLEKTWRASMFNVERWIPLRIKNKLCNKTIKKEKHRSEEKISSFSISIPLKLYLDSSDHEFFLRSHLVPIPAIITKIGTINGTKDAGPLRSTGLRTTDLVRLITGPRTAPLQPNGTQDTSRSTINHNDLKATNGFSPSRVI